jgi:hypothetical protein
VLVQMLAPLAHLFRSNQHTKRNGGEGYPISALRFEKGVFHGYFADLGSG